VTWFTHTHSPALAHSDVSDATPPSAPAADVVMRGECFTGRVSENSNKFGRVRPPYVRFDPNF